MINKDILNGSFIKEITKSSRLNITATKDTL